MEYVWNMYGMCMECVGGVGHVGCPLRCSQDSHLPRTYRVHSAYSRPQKGGEGPARAWPAAIWGLAPGPTAQCVISKEFCGKCMQSQRRYMRTPEIIASLIVPAHKASRVKGTDSAERAAKAVFPTD